MKGGVRTPPNSKLSARHQAAGSASMKGGVRTPPNWPATMGRRRPPTRFNEGRRAHAAEYTAARQGWCQSA